MFTGLVEEVGKIRKIQKRNDGIKISVECDKVIDGTKLGDSIALNGVCLTVVNIGNRQLDFEVSNETIKRSNFKNLSINDYINLERAMTPLSRLGGHIVQGHVDTIGEIFSINRLGEHTNVKIRFPKEYDYLVIEKGSIAIDGISLTINYIKEDIIDLNIIPHTLESTNLKYRKVSDIVNIEFDILGKYVAKMLKLYNKKEDYLKNLIQEWQK